jgi:hypothetical protein
MVLGTIPDPGKRSFKLPMALNSTPLNLISFLYRECSAEEAMDLRRDMALDFALREEFEALEQARRTIPRATFAPTDESLRRIMAYSAAIPAA